MMDDATPADGTPPAPPPETPRTRRRLWRRLLRVSLGLLALALALLVVAAATTQTRWFKNWLRGYVERSAARVLDGQLAIGRLDGNLFTGVRLDDVVLTQAGRPVVAIARVDASYNLRDLLGQGVVIDRLVLVRPVIRASQTPAGWNLTRLVKTTPGGRRPGRPVEITSFSISDGLVSIQPAASSTPTEVADLDLRLRLDSRPGELFLDLGHLSFDVPQRRLRVARGVVRLVKRGDTLVVESSRVDLAESHLRVSGEVRGLGSATTLDLRVASEALSFPEAGALVPAVSRMQLKPSFTATVRGPLSRIETALELHSAAGDVDGRVLVVLEGSARHVEADAALTRLNPAPWSGVAALDGSLTGRLRARVPLTGKDVTGTFRFQGPEARAAGFAASDVDVRGRFAGARVELEPSSARAYGAAVSVSGVIGPASGGRAGVQYALAGRVTDLDLRRLPASLPVPDLATDLDGDYRVAGEPGRVAGEVSLAASTVEGARLSEGAKGYLDWTKGNLRYGSSGEIAGLDLVRLGQALQLPALTDRRLTGMLNGRYAVDASGRSLDTLGLSADLSLGDSSIAGAELRGTTTAKARIAKQALSVDLESTFDSLEPAFVSAMPALDATLNGAVKGRFSIADLREPSNLDGIGFEGLVTLRESRVRDMTITSATVPVVLAARDLRLDDAAVVSPQGAVKATGTLALSRTGSSTLGYTVESANLEQVGKAAGQTLAGVASTTGRVTGNATELVAGGTARVDKLAAPGGVTVDSADVTYRVELPDLEIARARAESSLQARGVIVSGQALDAVDGTLTYAERRMGFDAKATAGERTLESRGTLHVEDAGQRVEVSRLTIASKGQTWSLAGTTPVSIVHDRRVVTLSPTTLVNGSQRLEAEGTIAIDPAARSALTVRVNEVRLADLVTVHERAGVPITGVLSGVADVGGTRESPEITVHFGLYSGAYRELTFDHLGGDLRYTGQRVTLDMRLDQQAGARLAAVGTVPVGLFAGEGARAPGEPIDLRVRSSTIGLDVVTGLTRAVREVGGTAQVNLHVTGTADNPEFAGGLSLKDGSFLLVPAGRRYSGVISEFRFEPGRLIIDNLRVLDDGKDALTMTGELGVRRLALGEMKLALVAERFGVMDNIYGTVDVNAVLTVSGTVTRPRVVGDVAVHSGRIEVDQVLTRLTAGLYATQPLEDNIPVTGVGQRPEAEEPGPAARPEAPPQAAAPATDPKEAKAAAAAVVSGLGLNLRVRVPDNLVLRGRNLRTSATSLGLGNINVTVGGDFRIRRDPGTPVALVGTVNTVRGNYDYRGRRFDILRDGRIQFQGAQPIDPAIDITAQRVIQPSGVEARIRLTGTVREPQMSLSSTPALDESDILALIVFNRDLNSLGSNERGAIASIAGSTAAGLVVAPFTQSIGRALDLDQFEVSATSEGSETGGLVTIGDQISSRMFVQFRQQFGTQEVSEFITEYNLSSFLRLQASLAEGEGVGAANRSLTRRIERAGVDLLFYFSY